MHGLPPLEAPEGIEFEFNMSSCEVGMLTAVPGVPRPARHSLHGSPLLSDTSQGQHLASSNPMERAESLRRQEKERGGREAVVRDSPVNSVSPPPLLAVRTIAMSGGATPPVEERKIRCCVCLAGDAD